MRPLSPSLIPALVQLVTFGLTLPTKESSIVAQSLSYPHSPSIRSETFNDRRNPLPQSLSPRRDPPPQIVAVWVPNTQTHVVITLGIQLTAATVSNLLLTAIGNVLNRLLQAGDGPLDHGSFNQVGPNAFSLQVWNVNNHQTTYGVLGSALRALHQWMADHQFTSASFGIYDGAHQVGNGVLNGPN